MKALAGSLQDQELNKEQLFEIMADQVHPEYQELPRTGISLEWERILSPAFIVSSDYGTRATTVLLVDRNNHVQFWERSFASGQPGVVNEVCYEYDIQAKTRNKQ